MIPLPPTALMFDGPAQDFESNGKEYLQHYIDLLGLKPTDRILDVGCGIGRKTIPLTQYLTTGSYVGIDPHPLGIQWCKAEITPRFPNFTFQWIDVHALGYAPFNTIAPAEFEFPFDPDSFDVVVLNSVFTHMLPAAVSHYLSEIHRVLRPGGRSFITWFLWGCQAVPTEMFPHQYGDTQYVANPSFPEQAISYWEKEVLDEYSHQGFRVTAVHYGHWSGQAGLAYQDIVIAEKPA